MKLYFAVNHGKVPQDFASESNCIAAATGQRKLSVSNQTRYQFTDIANIA